jgi:hypothetical protein
MNLPFTPEQFFEVFAEYNSAIWPAQLLLWAAAVALLVAVLRWPLSAGRAAATLLGMFWAWVGLAYHLAFFWQINPAAPLFATIALAAAAAFFRVGALKGKLQFEATLSARAMIGLAFALFALAVYPVIGFFAGHEYPAAPTFGLPCPLTLFTIGILMMASQGVPRVLSAGPLLWALIGTSAAIALGVPQDLSLIAAAAAGAYLLFRRPPLPIELEIPT